MVSPITDHDVEIREGEPSGTLDENQLDIVSRALHNGKRHFGVAGASLTWMNSPRMKDKLPEGWKPEVLAEATTAEQSTSQILRDWLKDKPNAVLVDSVHIVGAGKEKVDPETGLVEGGDTDHILIIGNNVYVIDTKNWRKKATYTVSDKGEVLRNSKPFPGGKVHMKQALHMWLNYLENDETEIAGMIFINNDDTETTRVYRDKNWWPHFWYLLEKKRFLDWLNEKYQEIPDDGKTSIDVYTVAQIAICCVKPYNRRDGLINLKHFR
jgi:hypothetical protein